MSEPWTYTGPTPTTGGTVTLIEGFSFCLSDQRGDLSPDSAQGLFFLDTRFLSELELHVCGIRPEPLSVAVANPFSGTFLARVVTDLVLGDSDGLAVLARGNPTSSSSGCATSVEACARRSPSGTTGPRIAPST